MDKRLKDGLRIGNFVVLPKSGSIIGAQGPQRLSPDRIELLLCLADRAGQTLTLNEVAESIGLDDETDAAILEQHLDAIRSALGDTGPNQRFVINDENGVTLIAPVRPGVGPGSDQNAEADNGISFWKQLQRRKVIRVGAAYIVLAWIAIQVADTVLPALGLPGWTITLTIGVALIGFPVAVVVAWLFELTPTGTLRDERQTPARSTQKQKIVDLTVIGALVVVVGYVAINVLFDVERARDTAVVTESSGFVAPMNTVAVLPFKYLSGPEDIAYISDGIADEILRTLSRLKELRVTARTASFYFRDKDVDVQTIAERLKVRHLLDGSVQIAGDRIRVTATMLDTSNGRQLWSETFDREMKDIFDIQSEIAKAVANGSRVALSADSTERLAHVPTESLDAYNFYLRGYDYLRQPRTTSVLENAQRLFHRALAFDPKYALALAGLCETQLATYIRTKSTASIDDAESNCQAALEIDNSLPEVHTALGRLYWNTGDHDQAELEFRKAISKSPNFYEAISGLGDTLVDKGDMKGAEQQFLNLVSLQPAYWGGYRKLGILYYRSGKDDKALPYFQRVTDLSPDNAPGWNNLGAVHYMLGNLEGAAIAWKRAIEIAPTQSMYANLGTMYYYLGRYVESVDMQDAALGLTPDDYRMWGRKAAAYQQMADKSVEARAAYNRAIDLATKVLEVNSNESDAAKNIALFYAHTDQQSQASEMVEHAIRLAPQDPDTHFFAALTYLTLGDEERSIEELEAAVVLGYSSKLIGSEPALAHLRDSDRFRVIVATADN